jgi:hypothetical protein
VERAIASESCDGHLHTPERGVLRRATSCEAAGYFEVTVTANNPKALTEEWNGHSWQLQHAVTPSGATYNTLASVSCVSTTSRRQ